MIRYLICRVLGHEFKPRMNPFSMTEIRCSSCGVKDFKLDEECAKDGCEKHGICLNCGYSR